MSDKKDTKLRDTKSSEPAKVQTPKELQPVKKEESKTKSSQLEGDKQKYVKPGKAARAARVAEKAAEGATQQVIPVEGKKNSESEKSKADLRRERQAIQVSKKTYR